MFPTWVFTVSGLTIIDSATPSLRPPQPSPPPSLPASLASELSPEAQARLDKFKSDYLAQRSSLQFYGRCFGVDG